MDRLNVGVIGVGHLGQHHARLYAHFPDTQLIGIVDLDRDRAKAIARQYNIPVFPNVQALLGEVDAISVAVPTAAHRNVVQRCLEAGVHVLVEKPLASTIDEARDLVDCASQRGVILQVGHIERFNPVMDVIRPFVQSPVFIECHRLAPYQVRGTDVDVVLDLMIHDLDLILSLNVGETKYVEGVGVKMQSSQVDCANARMTFSSGCFVSLTASRLSTSRLRTMHLFQSDLSLSVDFQSRHGLVYRRTDSSGGESAVIKETIQGTDEEPLKRELRAFVRSIQSGVSHGVSGEQGLHALELASAINESIRTAHASERFTRQTCSSG